MSKAPPYVPWYHGDFLRSTAGWTLVECAVYWKLLCTQWEIGVLPNDMTRLATIAGTDVTTVTSVWPVVGKKFTATVNGLINERMEAHRQNYIDFKRRQSEGGKKGMKARYENASKTASNVITLPVSKEPTRG